MKPDVKLPPPTGISRRTDALAYALDRMFRVPGTRMRFGLDPILGLIPGLGDTASTLLSVYIILEAVRAGASRHVLLRMAANVGIDAMLSLVPLAGDLVDAGWKANTRNLELLRHHLEDPARTRSASRIFIIGLFVVLVLIAIGTAALAVLIFRWIEGLIGWG